MAPWMLVMALMLPGGQQVSTAVGVQTYEECLTHVRMIENDPTRLAPWSGMCVRMPEPLPPKNSTPPKTNGSRPAGTAL